MSNVQRLFLVILVIFLSSLKIAMSEPNEETQNVPRKCADFVPKLMIFEPDRVFWPFSVELDVVPPFGLRRYQPTTTENTTKGLWSGDFEGRELFDSNGKVIQVYSDTSDVIFKLWKKGSKIAVAATITNVPTMKHLLRLFDLDKHVSFMEIDVDSPVDHVNMIKEASGLQFKDIVYFGSSHDVLKEIKRTLKVLTIYVNPKTGLNIKHIYNAIYFYNIRPYVRVINGKIKFVGNPRHRNERHSTQRTADKNSNFRRRKLYNNKYHRSNKR